MEPLQAADPARVGRFELLGRLADGGMGRVYLGVTRSGRPVAIKLIRAEIAADPKFRSRFAREVAAARTVGGFWTASVVDADPYAQTPWLATQYVPGPSLQQAVADAGVLPPATVRAISSRLAEALAAIHEAGLVHRDLKPGNVLLASDGPKVIDFGIARPFSTDTAPMTAVIGTPSYMAPEQIRGEALGPASDVFSLGSTLVYALCGRGPFDRGGPAGVLYRVLSGEPDLDGVSPDLYELVIGCLAKDPADRPTTTQLLDWLGPAGAIVTPYGDWRPPAPDPASTVLATTLRSYQAGAAPGPAPGSTVIDPDPQRRVKPSARANQPQRRFVATPIEHKHQLGAVKVLLGLGAAILGLVGLCYLATAVVGSITGDGLAAEDWLFIAGIGVAATVCAILVAVLGSPSGSPRPSLQITPKQIRFVDRQHKVSYRWREIDRVTVRRFRTEQGEATSTTGIFVLLQPGAPLPAPATDVDATGWIAVCPVDLFENPRSEIEQALASFAGPRWSPE